MSNDKMETGTSSFLDRHALTRRLEENLEVFLEDYGFKVFPFGHPVILQNNSWIASKLKKVESKSNLATVMVKFSPDYIVVREKEPKSFFFLDAKASITPVFFNTQVERIKNHYGKDRYLTPHDIGEIEREAWFSYNKFYTGKHVAIVVATPYNPKVLLAEWVSNIKCMWCYKETKESGPIPWNCKKCPLVLKSDDSGFGVVVNEFAAGSGIPHTNIHFGSMRTLDNFLSSEFGVKVKNDDYDSLLDFIKSWPLSKPKGRVSWGQFNGAIGRLKPKCPWLKCRKYDTEIPCPGDSESSMF